MNFKELAIKHGGKFHGPNVEHLSISEENYYLLAKAIIREASQQLVDKLEKIDRLAEAGLCYFDLTTVREFHKDVRSVSKQALAEFNKEFGE